MRDGKALASKRVIEVMPERAARMLSHADASPIPTGETIPIPVTTVRRLDMMGVGADERKARRWPLARHAGLACLRPPGAVRGYFFKCELM